MLRDCFDGLLRQKWRPGWACGVQALLPRPVNHTCGPSPACHPAASTPTPHPCTTTHPPLLPLPPAGVVQRRWVWVALFAPLWATLFINFGIGPVVSRTSDLLPVIGNVAAFAVAAAAVGKSPAISKQLGLTVDDPPEP